MPYKGYKQTPEHIQRGAESRKGKQHSISWKNNISKSLIGHDISEETKNKIGNANRGRIVSEETRKKHSISSMGNKSHLGQKSSEETRKKLSDNRRGHKHSEETKRKIGNAHKGFKHSEQSIQKMREARLNQKFDNKDTSIEVKIQNELHERGIYFEKHKSVCNLCIPDIVFFQEKIAIFCDGDYWHSFDNVKKRDETQTKVLRENGWKVYRFSETLINSSPKDCVDAIKELKEW